MTVVHEIPLDAYLDRERRMLSARGKVGGVISREDIEAILAEVGPLFPTPGRRYRFTILGGEPTTQRLRGVDERGIVRELELPDVKMEDVRMLVMEGTYAGRHGDPAAVHGGALLFVLDDGRAAVIADMDVQKLEAL